MLISYNWLKQYIDLPDSVTPEEVARKLKLGTVEVEKIINQGESLNGVVLGEIIACEKHPDADRLKVCQVKIKDETITIVCGGSNVSAGMFVAVAQVGASVRWHGEGEPIVLEKTKIRGVESFGMICASDEIGLGEMFPKKDEKEILDLTEMAKKNKIKAGTDLAQVLGLNDAILDIDNKSLSNRPDLWGHYGLAREVAALSHKKVKDYKNKNFKIKDVKNKLEVVIEDKKLCPRYMAVAVEGVKIEESPEWLKNKLIAVGLRPINNIVDITNYVMYDLGEPMHAFDAEKIKNKEDKFKIIVKRAFDQEKFKTLDGVERTLDLEMLVIASEDKTLALAGIMGGEESGITNDTNMVVFESANFEHGCIRRASTALGLRTDSSARFEKSLDPNLCETALKKALELTLQICPKARIASQIIDIGNYAVNVGPIELPFNFVFKKLGVQIPEKEIVKILTALGFKLKPKKDSWQVEIPTWRATKDITIPEDLIEEVARIYGYEKITSTLPKFKITPPIVNSLRLIENQVMDVLVKELGYNEVYNYSFVSSKQIENLGDKVEKYLELDNPLSKEKPYLRRNLILNLIENVKKNLSNFEVVKIVESGKIILSEESGMRVNLKGDELLPKQDTVLTAVYASKKDDVPFWNSRRALEFLSLHFNFNFEIVDLEKSAGYVHLGRSGEIKIKNKTVGAIYELNPKTQAKFDLDARLGVLEINLNSLNEVLLIDSFAKKYQPLPIYPEVERDLAIVVKKEIKSGEIIKEILNSSSLIKEVVLFDVYEGKHIGDDEKSLAFHLIFADREKTLTTLEIDEAIKKVLEILQKKFFSQIRK